MTPVRCSDPSCTACQSIPIQISVGVYRRPLFSLPALVAIIVALAFAVGLVFSGCDDGSATMAQTGFVTGDVTSCARNADFMDCGPQIWCSRPIEACIEAGCHIDGETLDLYADGSWRDPEPGAGTWSLSRSAGWTLLVLDGSVSKIGDPNGPNVLACPSQ